MSLIKAYLLFALFAAAAACGPEGTEKIDVLFGTYGSLPADFSNMNTSDVKNYVINDNGTFIIDGYYQCGAKKATPKEYTWVRHGDDAIDVLFHDAGAGGIDTWRISRGADCNQILVEVRRDGEALKAYPLARGEICLEKLPPCPGLNCAACGTVRCDEPPPPCDDAPR